MKAKIKSRAKKTWQIFIIILLAVTMTFIFQYAETNDNNNSIGVLSQLGSRSETFRIN